MISETGVCRCFAAGLEPVYIDSRWGAGVSYPCNYLSDANSEQCSNSDDN